MAKIINFTVPRVIPALLDRTKDQTIRPAWKHPNSWAGMMASAGTKMLHKPPRYEVGEEVKLVWNQRSKFVKFDFCPVCWKVKGAPQKWTHIKCRGTPIRFDKLLGYGKINEVHEVELEKRGMVLFINGQNTDEIPNIAKSLAKKDGFNHELELFEIIDKFYDINTPKEFYAYCWDWKKC